MLAVCSTHEHWEVLMNQQGVLQDAMECHKIRPNEWSHGCSVDGSVLIMMIMVIIVILYY